MTISYAGNFFRLLLFWKGSVWKAVWSELFVWLCLYYGIKFGFIYIFGSQNSTVSKVVIIYQGFVKELPIEFMLSFYVNQVITRWWSQIMAIPWPDETMALVGANICGSDGDSKLARHTIGRYLVLTQVLAIRGISTRVRKRFPTIIHIVDAGLMTKEEYALYKKLPNDYIRWQAPLSWAQNVITKFAGNDYSKIAASPIVAITNEFNKFRASLRTLFTYDWICFPLVYTQATGIGLYGYFALCLLGRQYYMSAVDPYVPFLTILKFIFYVGWFKKAQDMMRPFGEDDDDVELNYLLDRHLKVVSKIAEYSVDQRPPLVNSATNEKVYLSHTKWSADIEERPPQLHARIKVKRADKDKLFQLDKEVRPLNAISSEEMLLF